MPVALPAWSPVHETSQLSQCGRRTAELSDTRAGWRQFRLVYFFHRNWQFFLLDFCYYVNAFVLLFLLGFPDNTQLGAMCWCVRHPLPHPSSRSARPKGRSG
jgi:hypothetical protein